MKLEIEERKIDELKAQPSGNAALEFKKVGDARTFSVFADERKNYSGIKLLGGSKYRFRIEKYTDCWFDENVTAHPLHGWRGKANTPMLKLIRFVGSLLSYSTSDDLMVLLGVVEGQGNQENPQFSFAKNTLNVEELTKEKVIVGEFNSPGSGELYVFPNDVKSDLFKDFYENNVGYLKITLELVA